MTLGNFLAILIGGLIILIVGVSTAWGPVAWYCENYNNTITSIHFLSNIGPLGVELESCGDGMPHLIYGFIFIGFVGILSAVIVLLLAGLAYSERSSSKTINLSIALIILAIISLIDYGGFLIGFILVIGGSFATIFASKHQSKIPNITQRNAKTKVEEKVENEDAIAILKERYAKGELTKKQYEQMKKDIEG
jgi:putative membrane protein